MRPKDTYWEYLGTKEKKENVPVHKNFTKFYNNHRYIVKLVFVALYTRYETLPLLHCTKCPKNGGGKWRRGGSEIKLTILYLTI